MKLGHIHLFLVLRLTPNNAATGFAENQLEGALWHRPYLDQSGIICLEQTPSGRCSQVLLIRYQSAT